MAEVALTWIEGQRYLGVDSTQHSVVLSGGDDAGVRPAEALLLSLAACSAHDIVEIVWKQRARLVRLAVTVTGEQRATPPRRYTRIHLRYEAEAAGLSDARLRRAVELALRYCPVRASLNDEIDVTFEAVLLDSE
jgi:putative redox protein